MDKLSYNISSIKKVGGASRQNPRGELLEYFAGKIGKPIGYVAFRVTGMKLPDLYYLKSVCDSEEKRGQPWPKIFYGLLKPRDASSPQTH